MARARTAEIAAVVDWAALPADVRADLVLFADRLADGWSSAEISAATGLQTDDVSRRIARIRSAVAAQAA